MDFLTDYKLTPFSKLDLIKNSNLVESNLIEIYFKKKFISENWVYTTNGRNALNIALEYYNLSKSDFVTILTTSNNFYISNCVTTEIEKFCKWNREITNNTKVILVNHEFGFPFEQLVELKKYGLPIIEDSAYSFFSDNMQNTVGKVGDFVIFSFPKIFPIQFGGLLVIKEGIKIPNIPQLSNENLMYIKNVLSLYIQEKEQIINSRIRNYNILKSKIFVLGFKERFKLLPGIVPGVFMFSLEKVALDLAKLKIHFYNHGVECSVFYGENCFFIPCHQNLNNEDLEYFVQVLNSFIHKK